MSSTREILTACANSTTLRRVGYSAGFLLACPSICLGLLIAFGAIRYKKMDKSMLLSASAAFAVGVMGATYHAKKLLACSEEMRAVDHLRM